LIIIISITLLTYTVSILLNKKKLYPYRTYFIVIAVFGIFFNLFFFKYYNFFLNSANQFFGMLDVKTTFSPIDLVLPVGISFYTFQACGYILDVYTGRYRKQERLVSYATFVSFFPQLVAGPIERGKKLIPQLTDEKSFDYDLAVSGLRRILLGFFKKIVIADHLAMYVDHVFGSHQTISGVALLIASYFFAFQIYCDFSGYCDIAIGSARLFGVRLSENFKRPYLSISIDDFWHRWHITLTSWFRDYLYFPLGGNRVGLPRWSINILAVFFISGLWHGANWTFVIWGGVHGLMIIVEKTASWLVNLKKKNVQGTMPNTAIKVIITFQIVTFAWIFFRSTSVTVAFGIIHTIISDVFALGIKLTSFNFELGSLIAGAYGGMNKFELFLSFVLISLLMVFEYLQEKFPDLIENLVKLRVFRWTCYFALSYTILFSFNIFEKNEFIYFQF